MDDDKQIQWMQFDPVKRSPMISVNDKIAEATGFAPEVIQRVLLAQLEFQFAIGIAHGDAEDQQRATKLREKYPDLLRKSVTETAGKAETPVTYQLEATIVQLESGEPARTVVAVLATYKDLLALVDPGESNAYREWVARWIK